MKAFSAASAGAGIASAGAGASAAAATPAFTGLAAAVAASRLAMMGLVGVAIGGIAAAIMWMKKASDKYTAEMTDKYGVTKEQWTRANNIASDRMGARQLEEQRRTSELYSMEDNLRVAADPRHRARLEFGIARNKKWLEESEKITFEMELNKAIEEIKAEKGEEDDPMKDTNALLEKLLAKAEEEIGAINGLGKGSDKNPAGLKWKSMGTEDFYEIQRLGV
jgi:hypothetical protein